MSAARLSPVKRKTCRTCGVSKFPGHFRAQRRSCKTCEYEKRDLAKELQPARRYRAKNKAVLQEKQRNKSRVLAAWMDNLKGRPCLDCGGVYPPYVMDWDHIHGVKKFNISALRGQFGRGNIKTLVLDEIAKCDLVCSNCHRERSHQRRLEGELL